jgi:hypothetical protein
LIIAPPFDLLNTLPENQIVVEKNIFLNELFRVINFAAIAKNRTEIIEGQLNQICEKLGINNLFELMNNEYNNQNIDI